MFGDAKITFKFDKKYRLVEIKTERIELDAADLLGPIIESNMDMTAISDVDVDINALDLSIELSVKLSDFGKIKQGDVKVPYDVRKDAVEDPELDFDIDDYEGDEFDQPDDDQIRI